MDAYKTVLHVDDNSMFRDMIASMLDGTEFKVDFAIDGSDAVTKVFNNTYDLVLMDINMPVMDGHVSAKAIKKMLPNVPIVALTLYEVDLNLFDHFKDALKKPIRRDQLLETLRKNII